MLHSCMHTNFLENVENSGILHESFGHYKTYEILQDFVSNMEDSQKYLMQKLRKWKINFASNFEHYFT